MLQLFADCALDALKDGALSIPILFIAYLLMELLERSRRLDESILHAYSRKAGPVLGGLLGVIPCFPPAPSRSGPCWRCSLPPRMRCCPSCCRL